MKRRDFFKGLGTLPLIGRLLAKEALEPEPGHVQPDNNLVVPPEGMDFEEVVSTCFEPCNTPLNPGTSAVIQMEFNAEGDWSKLAHLYKEDKPEPKLLGRKIYTKKGGKT